MGRVEKPKTQKEQIDQMWMVLIGSNGDGIVEITKQNHRDIQELKSSIQHLQDRPKYGLKRCGAKASRRKKEKWMYS